MTQQAWVLPIVAIALVSASLGCRSFAPTTPSNTASTQASEALGALPEAATEPFFFRAVYHERRAPSSWVSLARIDKDGRVITADYASIQPCHSKRQTTTCKNLNFEFTLDRQNLVASLTGGQLSKAHPMRCTRQGSGVGSSMSCTEDAVALSTGGVALGGAIPDNVAGLFQVIYAEGGFAGNNAVVDEVDTQGKVLQPGVDLLKDCQKSQKTVTCKGEALVFVWHRQEMTGQLSGDGLKRALPLTCASRSSPSLKVTCVPDGHMPP